jgi:DNA-binding transcriptional ArsR family regulator/catechol 2,3-dioxygenase-like lactoylglutathione lyase family enzyme
MKKHQLGESQSLSKLNEEHRSEIAFEALGDPTRQEILRLLHETSLPLNKLAESFPISRPAISQHLSILLKAGFVRKRREGRYVIYEQAPDGWASIEDWITRYRLFEISRFTTKNEYKHPNSTLRISSITIPVTDQERSLRFYRDALGFTVVNDRVISDQVRWISVAPPDGLTTLVLHLAGDDGHDFAGRIGTHTGVLFMTDDIQALYPQLVTRGVRFTSVPTVREWGGIESTFADPDSNLFELVQLPREQQDR